VCDNFSLVSHELSKQDIFRIKHTKQELQLKIINKLSTNVQNNS